MENKRYKVDIDVILGAILMLFSGVFLYESFKIHKIAAQFPKIILTVLLILSAILTILGIRKTLNPQLKGKSDLLLNIDVIQAPMAVFAIIAAYIILIKFIGFFISTIIFVPIYMLYYGMKDLRIILITNISLNLFIYFLFVRVLHVMLP